MLLAKTFRSRTFRLALIAIAGFGAIVLLLLFYIYWSTTSYVLGRVDNSIVSEDVLLRKAYDRGGRPALEAAIRTRITDQAFSDAIYLLADRGEAPVVGTLDRWPKGFRTAPGWGEFNLPNSARQPSYRALVRTLPDHSHLLIALNISDLEAFTRKVDAALAFTILLIALIAGVVSVLATRRTVGRIESINATSRAIMERGLAARIRLRGTNDEWDELAKNLNSMLDRIEALMREVREVTDNLAHDLRTPLARIRGRLEKASSGARESRADQDLIDDTITDVDDVLRIFSSLMRISQIESASRTAAFGLVDLTALARDVSDLFDAAAEERGVKLTVAGQLPVLITGDKDLLFDAIANLIDNAIKHGRAKGCVTLTVQEGPGAAFVAVADDGPGIPAAEFQQVFKRFYRLERSRCTPGNGLGLSLVAAIVHLHGGQIEIRDNRPGLRFEFTLPNRRVG